MILKSQYKIFCKEIAKLFCNAETGLCVTGTTQRMINDFSDQTFEHFLQNIQQGRYYMLEYSNWHSDNNNCRSMKIDVRLTDVITGNVINGYWDYTAINCSNEQYKIADLNTLIGRKGYTLLDAPITTNTNTDIKKPRLIWNRNAQPYGIIFVPNTPGGSVTNPGSGGNTNFGTGGVIKIVDPAQVQQNQLSTQTSNAAFDLTSILNLLTNPVVLIGVVVGGYLIFRGSR